MSTRTIVIIPIVVVLGLASYAFSKMESMYILWPNAVTFIVFLLVSATIGFVIYGCIKGFDHLFPDD